ncbi:MAG TPA: hypothetical protein VEH04_16775 [Verrucomicrobiae bacterium]|nr:hypothetical protein [Verrucomicrobiae bacterium]
MSIRIEAAPIPASFQGTPQQWLEAFLDRLKVTSDGLSFVISDVAPGSNQGPWLKGGKKWFVWDEEVPGYVPLDISESYTPQIHIGDAAPDEEGEYAIWLKTSGSTIVGFFWWAGSSSGWVAQPKELQPGVITTAHLQDQAVTREKVKPGEIVGSLLGNDLPINKFERGAPYEVMQMSGDGGTARWGHWIKASAEQAVAVDSVIEVEHGLGRIPTYFVPVLVCKEEDRQWQPGDEVDLAMSVNSQDVSNNGSTFFRNSTKIGLRLGRLPSVRGKTDGTLSLAITSSKWKIKFYFGVG